MKKVLAFVLVLSMILGSFGMAFAAPADVAGEKYEDAVNVLVELGVVAGYKDGTFRPENIVTRAEMATFLIKAMGLADYAVAKSEFSDMAGHWADPFVAYAASLGIVAGYADGTFKPDVTVSYDQAITMVIQALGYKGEYLVGGFPGAFVNQAKALGILKGVKAGAAGANRGDIATLLYNALPKAFVRYDNEGALQTAGGSMMARLGAEFVDAEFVVTGEEDAAINLKEYQGALVKAWVNEDEEIIAVEVQSETVVAEYDDEEGVFVVDEKEFKLDKLEEDLEVAMFRNGDAAGTVEFATLFVDGEEYVLAVKTSGKYFTEVYSASVWEADGEFQMTEDDVEALAEDFELAGYEFAMTDNDEIDADEVVVLGVAALDKIAEDHIVTYYLDSEGLVVKVEVGTETVEGTVKKINAEEDVVTIEGKKYDVEAGLVGMGAEGTFYMNYAGTIVAFEGVEPEAKDYAIITVDMAEVTPSAEYGEEAESSVKVKMITEDGKEAVYVVEEDFAEVVTMAAFTANTVVVYNLDKNGEIDAIEVVDMIAAGDDQVTSKGYLAGKEFADEVVVFTYDAEEDEYALAAKKDIPAKEELLGTVYALNEDDEIAFVILDAAVGVDEESVFAVVVGAEKAYNADEDIVWEVELLVDGKEAVKLTVSDATVVPADTNLYELAFDGSDIEAFELVEGEAVTAAAVKNGDIKVEGAGFVDVADDVVVYLINEDGDFEVSALTKIEEGDAVVLYELDGEDDEDGIDVVIYTEA